MKVRYFRLSEPSGEFTWPHAPNAWTCRQLLQQADIVNGWVSFDTVAYDPSMGPDGSVWCGLNVLDPERFGLLYRFDIAKSRFFRADLGPVLDRFDLKIHKGLHVSKGRLIFATASFFDAPEQEASEGGKLIVYDPIGERVLQADVAVGRRSGFPVSGQYIQSSVFDAKTDTIYGGTYPIEVFFSYDVKTRTTQYLAHLQGTQIGQPHNFVVDDEGMVWGTYGIRNGWSYLANQFPIRPFVYAPQPGTIEWLESVCLPRSSDGDDAGNDAIAALGDWIYFADKASNLSRVHRQRKTVEYLGRTSMHGRLAGLISAGGDLWGVTGDRGEISLVRVHDGAIETKGPLVAEDGTRPERLHDLTLVSPGRFFAGENDNHHRSSYLWEIVVDEAWGA